MSVSTNFLRSSSPITVPDPARFLASSLEPIIVTDSTLSFADSNDVADSIINADIVINACLVSIIFLIIFFPLPKSIKIPRRK